MMENDFFYFLNYVDVIFISAIERMRACDFADWFHQVEQPVCRDIYGCSRSIITKVEFLNVSIQILNII